MRKLFTRLLGTFILFGVLSFQVVAQGTFTNTGLSPSSGTCLAESVEDFVITFGRDVYPSHLGVIALSNANATELITMQIQIPAGDPNKMEFTGVFGLNDEDVNWTITFAGKTVTINLGDHELMPYTPYYITVSEDAIKDKATGVANYFVGLQENSPITLDNAYCHLDANCGVLVDDSYNTPDWHFTTPREGVLTAIEFDPEDDADNVSVGKGLYDGDDDYFTVEFDRPIYWALGDCSDGNALAASWLKAGYFALYTSTDGTFGEYGGDVVAHQLSHLEIDGNTLMFQFDDIDALDYSAAYYLRVRYGVISDQYGNIWEGINTNTDWNFTTKDGSPAFVESIEWDLDGSCDQPTPNNDIVITFIDGYPTADDGFEQTDADLLDASYSQVNSTTIKNFVKIFDDAEAEVAYTVVSVTRTASPQEVIVTIRPTNNMASFADYTVSVLEGMFDLGREPIAAYSETLTSGDYEAPVSLTATGSPQGTTFYIYGKLDEPGQIHYIVVKDDDMANAAGTNLDYYAPTLQNVFDVVTIPATSYTSNSASINVEASGTIDVVDSDLTYPEHITGLDQTHGTYYRVYFFTVDNACENNANGWTAEFPGNNVSAAKTAKAPYLKQATYDILPPEVVSWTGDLVSDLEEFDTPDMPDCSDTYLSRDGAIYIEMNENVEQAAGWGSAITPAYIPSIFTVEVDNGSDPAYEVSLNASACEYDETTFTFKLVPLMPFVSGAEVTVSFRPNRIQDKMDDPEFGYNGTELLNVTDAMYSETFCVEVYTGPVIVCDETNPHDGEDEVGRAQSITITYDQELFAPVYHGGVAISNDVEDLTWIGNYIKIYEGADASSAPASMVIIHQEGAPALDMFEFGFANVGGKAVITVDLVVGQEYVSEMFYYVEVEADLQSREGYTLAWSDADPSEYEACVPENYTFVFQAEDTRAPVCIFYEDEDMDDTANLGILDGKLDVQNGNYILVEIDEWIHLGFENFNELDPSEVIYDANALRPYFTLKNSAGEDIRFDVKNFSLDTRVDYLNPGIATFYIDPYELESGGALVEDPNFNKGEEYTVCFLGVADVLDPAYPGEDIAADHNMNGVGAACATFTVQDDPEDVVCIVSATLDGEVLDIVADYDSPMAEIHFHEDMLRLELSFAGPMEANAGAVSIYTVDGNNLVITADAGDFSFVPGSNGSVWFYEYDMSTPTNWVEDEEYYIAIGAIGAFTGYADYDCSYPEEVDFVVSHFLTIDGTAPYVTDLLDMLPCWDPKNPADIILTFDEPIVKGENKMLEIRNSSLGLIRQLNVSNSNVTVSVTGDSLIFDASMFASHLNFDEEYYLVYPEGLVYNLAGLPNDDVTDPTAWTFTVCSDVAPEYTCVFAPSGNIQDGTNVVFEINFDEPVWAVPGKQVQVYDADADNATANALENFFVTEMQRLNGGKTFRFVSTWDAEFDMCYSVNIADSAFVDSGSNKVDAIVSKPIGGLSVTSCTWDFCIRDDEGPLVKLWPEDEEISIPVNAHLYAYINEEPWVDNGGTELLPLQAVLSGDQRAKQFFTITYGGVNGTANVLDPANWTLEFVGQDKQHLRIAIYDPNGYVFDGSVNYPTMLSNTNYVLSFNPSPSPGIDLVDIWGNVASADEVFFTTEDVIDPIFNDVSLYECADFPDQISFTAEIDEPGTIHYKVVNVETEAVVASGSKVTGELVAGDGLNAIDVTVEGIEANTELGYDFDVILWAFDDEEDLYDEIPEIEATWMWESDEPWYFAIEQHWRIQDFVPAPNGPTYSDTLSCTLCDDDAPLLVETTPIMVGEDRTMDFALNGDIYLRFNENVQLANTTDQGFTIYLRNYENNIGVPLGWELVSEADSTPVAESNFVKLYILDIDEPEIYQEFLANELGELLSETKYYLEVDRYAVSDLDGCDGVNYFEEVVGKDMWFKTQDATPPCLVSVSPINDEDEFPCGVEPNENIKLTFSDTNPIVKNFLENGDSNFVYIYRVVDMAVPHERLALSNAIATDNADGTYTFEFVTNVLYRSAETYVVRVPSGIFADNPANGDGNAWTGETCPGDFPLPEYLGSTGYSWTFTVKDYLPPVPMWTVVEHLDYLDIVLADDQYEANIHPDGTSAGTGMGPQNGQAGEPGNGIATSSFLKVHFDEDVFIRNRSASGTQPVYMPMEDVLYDVDSLFIDDLYALLDIETKLIEGEDDFTQLVAPIWTKVGGVWTLQNEDDVDFWIADVPDNRTIVIEITQGEEQWIPFLSSEVTYGLNSNSIYTVSLTGGIAYDQGSEDCPENEMGDIDNLVTIYTRDDIPPTLDVLDGGASVMSDVKGEGSLWIDCDGNEMMVNCVDKDGPLTIQFDGEVVKTPFVGIGYEDLTYADWVHNNINWYTHSNLPLTKADLLYPNEDNKFLHVYHIVPSLAVEPCEDATTENPSKARTLISMTKTAVDLSDVTVEVVDGKTTIQLFLDDEFASLGYYQVVFEPGTVKDKKRIPNGNVFLGDSVIFKVEDYEGPIVVADGLFPANDPTCAAPIENTIDKLTIEYDQDIVLNDEGLEIELRWKHGQQHRVFTADDCTISEDDPNVLVINFPEGFKLDDFESYYVIVPEGFVTDVNECEAIPSAAINEDDQGYYEWAFCTADATPPTAILYIPNSTRDEEGNMIAVNDSVPTASDLTIIFDENIKIEDCTSGGLFIYHNDLLDGFELGTDFGNFIEFIPYSEGVVSGTDQYKGLLSDKVTFDPETTFDKNGIYYIRATAAADGGTCGVYDFADNGWSGIGDTITWSFVVSNDVDILLASTTPEYNHAVAPNVYADCFPSTDYAYVEASLSMTFEDEDGQDVPVAPREGLIKIYEYTYNPETFQYEEKLWVQYEVNDENVVFNGNEVTINDVILKDNIQNFNAAANKHEFYYVIIESGTIISAIPGSTQYFAGIGDAFTWRFKTCADEVFVADEPIIHSPNIVTDMEAAENLTKEEASTLIVEFGEGVGPIEGTDKFVTVYKVEPEEGDEPLQLILDATMFEDRMLTIDFDSTWIDDETHYYVVIEEGAFGDTATVPNPVFEFGGIGIWEFATGDNTPPTPIEVAPAMDDDCVEGAFDLTLLYDETFGVIANAGTITFEDEEGTVWATYTQDDLMISEENENLVTVAVSGLPDTTLIIATLSEGLVIDIVGHVSPEYVWQFTTGENTLPTAVVVSPELAITPDTVLVIEFSEPVNVNTLEGEVTLVGGPEDVVVTLVSEDSITYSAAVTGLASGVEYQVVFADGSFVDINEGCTPNSIEADSYITFQVADIEPPVAEYYPTLAEDYIGLELMMVFDSEVAVVGGEMHIFDAIEDTLVMTIDVEDLETSDNVTYTYATDDLYFGTFYILIDEGSFIDEAAAPMGQVYEGLVNNDDWILRITKTSFDNCYTIISPLDGTTGVELTTELILEFCNERIVAGDAPYNYVTIAKQDIGSSDFFEFFIVDSMISEDRKTLTIPVEGLEELTTYSVIIAPRAIMDEAGNSFAGIIDANRWNFTTVDITDPTVVSVSPESGEMDNVFSVTLTFSENVVNVADGVQVTGGEATVSGSGSVYTVTITADDMSEVVMTLTSTITDESGNELEESSYTYTVADNTAPTIVSVDPADGTEELDEEFVVTVEFDEDVVVEDGDIVVTGGTFTYTVDGSTVTITITSEILKSVVVRLTNGITDLAGNSFAGEVFTYTTKTTSVDAMKLAIDIYPNPFNEFINIYSADKVDITKAVITNIAGQVVKEVVYPGSTIETTELRSGVYVISLHTEDGIAKTQRIVK